MPQRQLLGHQTAQRMADNMGSRRCDGLEPPRDVVGHLGRRVRAAEPVAPAHVPGVKSESPIPRSEVALGQAKGTMIAPQAAQERQRFSVLARLLVVERMGVHKNTGHVPSTHSHPQTVTAPQGRFILRLSLTRVPPDFSRWHMSVAVPRRQARLARQGARAAFSCAVVPACMEAADCPGPALVIEPAGLNFSADPLVVCSWCGRRERISSLLFSRPVMLAWVAPGCKDKPRRLRCVLPQA